MISDVHWEPPEPAKLLITTHRLAEILDVPLWRAYVISHSLDRVYYGPKATHFRVAMTSVRRYKQLVDQGLTEPQASQAMYRIKTQPIAAKASQRVQTASQPWRRRGRRWA